MSEILAYEYTKDNKIYYQGLHLDCSGGDNSPRSCSLEKVQSVLTTILFPHLQLLSPLKLGATFVAQVGTSLALS